MVKSNTLDSLGTVPKHTAVSQVPLNNPYSQQNLKTTALYITCIGHMHLGKLRPKEMSIIAQGPSNSSFVE